ncbi:MAG: hypothetical protein RI947_653 [Candidatus Parcubacteria bacterium]|jgi:hypothetical protein
MAPEIRTAIVQSITNALTGYISDEKLHEGRVETKYYNNNDPSIMLLWADRGLTKGVLISFGQTGELYIEIYAAVDIGLQRKWNKEHIQTIPSIERGDNKDWLPYLMVTIKSARTIVGAWKESDLVWTAPILVDCGSIDIRVGSIPTVASPRIPRSAYRLSPLTLLLGMFMCFLLVVATLFIESRDTRTLFVFLFALGQTALLWIHISGKQIKLKRGG